MIPVGQQGPQSSYESQRLVEHDVVPGLRDFDDRGRVAEEESGS
jgi:hypothetical protein